MTKCPACLGVVSEAAETCVHCGHPLRPRTKTSWVTFWVFLLLSISLTANVLAVMRLGLFDGTTCIKQQSYENPTRQQIEPQPTKLQRLERTELIPKLHVLVRKFNDQPFVKPNLFLTSTRVFLDVSEQEILLIFEYDVASSFDQVTFKDGTLRDLLMTSYCNADESPFLALNEVGVLFRYMKDEAAIYEEKLRRCEI